MDPTITDTLERLKSMYHANDAAARIQLSALIQVVVARLDDSNAAELDQIRHSLEKWSAYEKPSDTRSYILGMANSLNQLIDLVVVKKHSEMHLLRLSRHEKSILRYLSEHPSSAPSQLMVALHFENRQNMSNYLRKLKTKELVRSLETGKNQWYSLTIKGKKAVERLLSEEHQASTSEDKPIAAKESIKEAPISKLIERLMARQSIPEIKEEPDFSRFARSAEREESPAYRTVVSVSPVVHATSYNLFKQVDLKEAHAMPIDVSKLVYKGGRGIDDDSFLDGTRFAVLK